MNDLKSLFKSFCYAGKGFFWVLGHERNFRIHLTCMAYMFFFLLRYDFFDVSRTQFAILFLACGLVIGGELLNTGIENADNSVTEERRKSIEISKNTAAGAVLVFAVFAVLVGVAIMWQPEAFSALFSYYLAAPWRIAAFAVSLVVATLFIFKFNFKEKEN